MQWDSSKQVRLAAATVMGSLGEGLGRRMANQLKPLMRVWYLAMHDTDREIGQAASSALERAFPAGAKRQKAIRVCTEEIADGISSCLRLSQAREVQEEGMSKEEAGDRLVRMHCSGLRAAASLMRTLAPERGEEGEGINSIESLIEETKLFNRFCKHQRSVARAEAYRLLRTLAESLPDRIADRWRSYFASRVAARLEEKDPACVPELMALAVAVAKRFGESALEECVDPLAQGEFLRDGIASCGDAAGQVLLPFLASLPISSLLASSGDAAGSMLQRASEALRLSRSPEGRGQLAEGVCESCAYLALKASEVLASKAERQEAQERLLVGVLIDRVATCALDQHDVTSARAFARAVARGASIPPEGNCDLRMMESLLQHLRRHLDDPGVTRPLLSNLRDELRKDAGTQLGSLLKRGLIEPLLANVSEEGKHGLFSEVVEIFEEEVHQCDSFESLALWCANELGDSPLETRSAVAASLALASPEWLRKLIALVLEDGAAEEEPLALLGAVISVIRERASPHRMPFFRSDELDEVVIRSARNITTRGAPTVLEMALVEEGGQAAMTSEETWSEALRAVHSAMTAFEVGDPDKREAAMIAMDIAGSVIPQSMPRGHDESGPKVNLLEEVFALHLVAFGLGREAKEETSNAIFVKAEQVWQSVMASATPQGGAYVEVERPSWLDEHEAEELASRLSVCARAAAIARPSDDGSHQIAGAWLDAVCAFGADRQRALLAVTSPLAGWPQVVRPSKASQSGHPENDLSDEEAGELASRGLPQLATRIGVLFAEHVDTGTGWVLGEGMAHRHTRDEAVTPLREGRLRAGPAEAALSALAEATRRPQGGEDDAALEGVQVMGAAMSDAAASRTGEAEEALQLCLEREAKNWVDASESELAESWLPHASKGLRKVDAEPCGQLVKTTVRWLKKARELLAQKGALTREAAQAMRAAAGCVNATPTLAPPRSEMSRFTTGEEEKELVATWESASNAFKSNSAELAGTEEESALAALAEATVERAGMRLEGKHWRPLLRLLESWALAVLPVVEDEVERASSAAESAKEDEDGEEDNDAARAKVALAQLALVVLEAVESLPVEATEVEIGKDKPSSGDVVPYSTVQGAGALASSLLSADWPQVRSSCLEAAHRLLMCAGGLRARRKGPLLEAIGFGEGFWVALARVCSFRSPIATRRAAEAFDSWEEAGVVSVHALYALVTNANWSEEEPACSLAVAACFALRSEHLHEAAVLGLDGTLKSLEELKSATEELHNAQREAAEGQDGETADAHGEMPSAAELACVREPLRRVVASSGKPGPGHALCWAILASYVSDMGAEDAWRPRLASFVAEAGTLPRLLEALLSRIPLPENPATQEVDAEVDAAWEAAREPERRLDLGPLAQKGEEGWGCLQAEVLVGLWALLLRAFPAGVRGWFAEAKDKRGAARLEAMTAARVSPGLVEEEVRRACREGPRGNSLKVRASKSGEVMAQYAIEDAVLELTVSLPRAYPLRPPEVWVSRRVGIGEARQRRWLLTMSALLRNQDGAIGTALQMWARNLSKEFDGLEACPICYSVVHTSSGALPNFTCKQCKQRFHSQCLYHWFQSSAKSECPMCRHKF